MSDAYESIPNSPGHHPGDTSEHDVGMSVRAENPPAESRSGEPARLYQLVYHADRGHYRVHRWSPSGEATVASGYEELGRYTSDEDLTEALEDLPAETRYVVFENADTGQVFFDREGHLSGNWSGEGDFDQITIFEDEDAAATYADRRQRELTGGTADASE